MFRAIGCRAPVRSPNDDESPGEPSANGPNARVNEPGTSSVGDVCVTVAQRITRPPRSRKRLGAEVQQSNRVGKIVLTSEAERIEAHRLLGEQGERRIRTPTVTKDRRHLVGRAIDHDQSLELCVVRHGGLRVRMHEILHDVGRCVVPGVVGDEGRRQTGPRRIAQRRREKLVNTAHKQLVRAALVAWYVRVNERIPDEVRM